MAEAFKNLEERLQEASHPVCETCKGPIGRDVDGIIDLFKG